MTQSGHRQQFDECTWEDEDNVLFSGIRMDGTEWLRWVFPWARRPMGDTGNKRRVRRLLSDRLDSYYEALVDAARRDARERWEQIIRQSDSDRLHGS